MEVRSEIRRKQNEKWIKNDWRLKQKWSEIGSKLNQYSIKIERKLNQYSIEIGLKLNANWNNIRLKLKLYPTKQIVNPKNHSILIHDILTPEIKEKANERYYDEYQQKMTFPTLFGRTRHNFFLQILPPFW